MSLNPQPIPPVSEETVLVAVAAFPKGSLYLRLRDELGVFYQDCDFDNLYSFIQYMVNQDTHLGG